MNSYEIAETAYKQVIYAMNRARVTVRKNRDILEGLLDNKDLDQIDSQDVLDMFSKVDDIFHKLMVISER